MIDPLTVKNKGWITFFVMAATIMEVIDSTIANVALPHMQGALNASASQVTWILTSYIVAAAVAIPVTGYLVGVYGVRKVLLTSVAGFTIFSMLCGASTTLGQMVLFRLLQGVFGAALIPLSQAILMQINPPEKHGQAMAIWGMGIMVAPILGPIVGGYFTENFNWRWIFFINVPVGIIAYIGLFVVLDKSEKTHTSFDKLGFFLVSIFIASLQIMLERGEQVDWFSSIEIVLYAVTCIVSAFLFGVFGTMVRKHPFIPLEIFVDRNFLFSTVIMFFTGALLFASIVCMPIFLQSVIGYDVLSSGILVAPRGIGTLLSMFIVGQIVSKIDPRLIAGFGLIMTTVGVYFMSHFDKDVSSFTIIWTGVVHGFGFGFIFVPLSITAFKTLKPALIPQAAAIFSLLRNIGGSIGIALIAYFISHSMKLNHAIMSEFTNRSSKQVVSYMQKAGVQSEVVKIAILEGQINQQSAIISYVSSFRIIMIVNIIAIPLVFLIKKANLKPGEKIDIGVH